ncbi:unnamed protein product [Amoebophrya sp. A25]|nr:unnamed protein product [Amoebophrya sp. A25]|eukprot:GSA25T00021005001.1
MKFTGDLTADDVNRWIEVYLLTRWKKWKEVYVEPNERRNWNLILIMDGAGIHRLNSDLGLHAEGVHKQADGVWIMHLYPHITKFVQPLDQNCILRTKAAVRRETESSSPVDAWNLITKNVSLYQEICSNEEEFRRCGFCSLPSTTRAPEGDIFSRTREFLYETRAWVPQASE